jgi:hypothetical protein
MPIDDLSLVTQAIRTRIETGFKEFAGLTVVTTAAAPDEITSTNDPNTISVYLYHLIEDPQFKNSFPQVGTGPVPIAVSPLSLILHYVITAHNPILDDPDMRAMHEQMLLGRVAKLMHDSPQLPVVPPPPAPITDFVEVILRPVSIEESLQFWANDEEVFTRASVWIEARVVFITPEQPQTIPGIVLSVGSFVVVGFGPQLTASQNTLAFTTPTGAAQKLSVQPARVALFGTADPPSDPANPAVANNNALTITGAEFGLGPHLLELASGGVTVRLDLDNAATQNPSWQVALGDTTIGLRFLSTIVDTTVNPPATVTLLPGTYAARFIDNELPLTRSSTAIAFSVVPQINSLTAAGPSGNNDGIFQITVSGGYLQNAALQGTFQLIVGSEILTDVTESSSSPLAGQFAVTGTGTILLHRTVVPLEQVSPTQPLPVNLIIGGTNATPVWITQSP